MPSFSREIALSLYRWSTMSFRVNLSRGYAAAGTYPAAVLFYHRVADTHPSSWTISTTNFLQQLDWVQRNATFASLDDIRTSQRNGHRSTAMVGLTFDDGYGENCLRAIPEIVQRRIPCTYFVSTHFVESGEPFPHDVRAGQPLLPNTISEIQSMAKNGITIGAHSHTHTDLGQNLSQQQLRIEIADVRKKLQDWTQQPINYFAFPYGLKSNVSQKAIDCIFESGYECFVSASGGLNWPGDDGKHLRRIHGDPGMAAFVNWLTIDPRKLRLPSPVEHLRITPGNTGYSSPQDGSNNKN